MQPLAAFPEAERRGIRGLFTDIDDTLTTDGRLPAAAYAALERVHEAGLLPVPVTGRPAGWCDHIARFWPVDGVVGENGAFYFWHDREGRRLHRRFVQDAEERRRNRLALDRLAARIHAEVPGTAPASDQDYRACDLAIDYCEDVPALPADAVARIVDLATEAGAAAKVSSIHVNIWFGDYDKLSTTRLMMAERYGIDLERARAAYLFVGDSPNDAPMFAYFPNAAGVANLRRFQAGIEALPRFVTRHDGGAGFVEVADTLLTERRT